MSRKRKAGRERGERLLKRERESEVLDPLRIPPGVTNEDNLMWRGVREDVRRGRDKRELRVERQLAIAVKLGQLDALALSDYHWRVWHPSAPDRYLDFWPRSEKGRDLKRNETFHATVAVLISRLRP